MGIHINTMRRVDFFLGVPLCFLGTLLKKLCALLFRSDPERECRNILFIGLSETGSTILADPAMAKIKSSRDVDLHFVCFEKNSAVLELLGTIPNSNIFKIRETDGVALAIDVLRFFLWTRARQIDSVIDLELFSRFTALLAGFSGADRTIGFHSFYNEGLYRGDFLSHKVVYNPHQHISKNFIALANALLSEKNEIPFSKAIISDTEILLQKALIGAPEKSSILGKVAEAYPSFDTEYYKIVLFNTNASDLVPLRRWPKEYYIELAGMLLDQYSRVIILLPGIESEHSWNDSIVFAVNDERCVNFAGYTTLAELPALYAVSEFMVTNDSGPAHFAAVTSMPEFVFFGPETPALYGPLGTMTPLYAGLACSPCVSAANHRQSPCNDNICLKMITPEKVFKILKPSLEAM
ncbi:MAG: glycosyltransferase family 9 protein [Desulfuromonadaceae bacterium]|nr:glycosyltransferase family 9 protein [Desulfuromonadaceae bacterium]